MVIDGIIMCSDMYMSQALKLCPELIILQYDFNQYEKVSEQVIVDGK